MLWYMLSWLVNFILIAVVLGIVGEILGEKIENHQTLAAFMIFLLPTVLEVLSYLVNAKPFLANMVA